MLIYSCNTEESEDSISESDDRVNSNSYSEDRDSVIESDSSVMFDHSDQSNVTVR